EGAWRVRTPAAPARRRREPIWARRRTSGSCLPPGAPMRLIRPPDIPASEITPEATYLRRREFRAGAGAAAWAALPLPPGLAARDSRPAGQGRGRDELTPYEDVTGYNNF